MTNATTTNSQDDARWVSVPEAAEVLGVHPMTLYRLARRNVVPHIRLGRTVRVNMTELKEVLTRGPAEEA